MKRPLNLLIPMAGQGKRFRRAGYDTYKPFLPIFGKPMVQWVLDAFPPDVTKRVLADPTLLTAEQLDYLRAQPGVVVHCISPHSLGPAYTIHQARAELPLDQAFFIAYADIFWTWDWASVRDTLDVDGVVFTRRAFHPHLVGNNYSAFCRTDPADPGRLVEIREKGSFTDDWMSEPLSVGAFYVRDGRTMARAISTMITEDRRVSQEFFPSLLFNDILAAGGEVRLQDVDFFVHWGVPEQLEDLRGWVRTARSLASPPLPRDAVNVCCMGGSGARMQGYSALPKALIPVADGSPMFRFVARRFGCRTDRFIVSDPMREAVRSRGVGEEQLVSVGPPTTSQLATLALAGGFLARQERFYLTSCDAFGLWDEHAFMDLLSRQRPDAVVFTFEPTLLQERLGGGHTYVECAGDRVTRIHIKHRPAGDVQGLAGFFWFRDGAVFSRLADIPADPDHELCADHVLKYLVDTGAKVAAFPLDAYVHLGSPAELQEFEFWNRYHTVFQAAD